MLLLSLLNTGVSPVENFLKGVIQVQNIKGTVLSTVQLCILHDLLEAENLRREYVHEAQTYLQRALKRIGYSPEKLEAVSGAYSIGRIVRKANPFLEKNKIMIILPTATWGPTGTRVGELSLTPMEDASLLLHLADPSTRRELLRNPSRVFASALRPPLPKGRSS